ncbi:LysR family transcriptional regulator [Mesorhizobium sp. M1E.F.Ca.ET.063.01.1.1]|uniref:LysR family transcriptional regulator n=1 Tax=Mesorhizobium sp. M1E.F.Ca.ET.063.01.1.1 TaxID=2496750 RepID=UPI000FCBD4F5|nr:LysR family transcriptional regulator [Mesorhizobium sp. M1E.F.Ca.ET.063.01.1.1]RUW86121.1 LysR family transcriptional regulator [Mesorhizobium sp. M1E.F.Ca.ET.063.01.1.1]
MKWRFEDILTFINVVEAGSVTSAATRLNTSKSVVSKRISDLEAALHVELFRRSAGSVKPNERARSLYEQIVPLVQAMAEATEGVSDRTEGLSGRLKMAVPVSFGTKFLGPIIAEFARQHPDLEIAVDYEDRPVSLTQGNYDLGIRMGPLNESSLKARKLCEYARIVCCSPEYSRNFGLPKSIAELANHTRIDYAHVRASDLWQFENDGKCGRPIPVLMRSRIVANNFEAMKDMAIAGLGLVLLPEFLAAESLREGTLIPAMPHIKARADTISAVYPYTRHVSLKVRRFIDHLVASLAPPRPWCPQVNEGDDLKSSRATHRASVAA